jgi:divalent metal cation (Fe/Co/Zn/Cd) transporter
MSDAATDYAPLEPRGRRLQQGLRLEYFTIGWNLLEAIVGMAAGVIAGSISLVAFALDSIVEASSGAVLVLRFRGEAKGGFSDDLERKALRRLALAFLALAAYVAFRAVRTLMTGSRPESSPTGIVLALVSLLVMPVLARRKRMLSREMESRALEADSIQTSLCTYLSAILLLGLLANSLRGWWWADPVAALCLAGIAANEGRELWAEEDRCSL